MTYPEEVGRRIRDARKRRPRPNSQAWLAGELGIKQRTVSHYERGRSAPSLEMLRRIAAVLGVSPAYLSALDDLTPRETGLLQIFRGTSDDGKDLIYRVAESQPGIYRPDKKAE